MRRRRSRLRKVKQKRDVVQALMFLVLGVGVLIAFFVWGIPAFAKFAGLLIKDKQYVNEDVSLPPAKPVLLDVPESTNSGTLKIEGFGESGSDVNVYLNNIKVKTVLVGEDGVFKVDGLKLDVGDNWLYVVAERDGKDSEKSRDYKINYDNEAPELEVLYPSDGQEFNGDGQKVIKVKGTVSDDVDSVMVGDRIAIIENEKEFHVDYELREGDQEIEVVARDKAGNETKKTVKVVWRQ